MKLESSAQNLSLEYFSRYAMSQYQKLDLESTVIEFIVAFSERALICGNNHTYYDPYLLTQLVSGAQGYCFMDPSDLDLAHLEGIAGKYAMEILPYVPQYIKVAILDSIFFQLNLIENLKPSITYEFRGLANQKSLDRARKIVELAKIEHKSKVLLIGAIADIAHIILEKGAELQIADFSLAGTEIENIHIQYDATKLIEWADTIIMTGNTLKTNTLGQLLGLTEKFSKPVLVYAMSGASIAPRYLDYGVSVVTSEPFPYYWFAQTPSIMNVYTRRPHCAIKEN